MLWLALHFRHLPLEVYTRGTRDVQPQSIAIVSGAESGATVVAANRLAQARGVCAGMSLSTACALASGLHTITRDIARERATLIRIAAWSLQFTSLVSIAEAEHVVLLEIEGSLKLFGGLGKLHRHITRGVAELGFNAGIACAPTPLAALWFARAGMALRVQHHDAMRLALEKLPVSLLCDNNTARTMLESFGAHTLGECLRLPRDGLARRAGQRLLDDLDRALGLRPDPRLPFVPPQTYNAALPLPAPVAHADALLFAARRLLAELCGWLSATGHGVQCPRFEFFHEKQIVTIITLELTSASRDLDHLTSLLRERLARTELPCAAIEITIASGRVIPLAARNLSFLPGGAGQEESASRFVERLNARLGASTICGLTPHADYRPERAWRLCRPGAAARESASPMPARPLWLLTPPRPLRETGAAPRDHDGGPLALLAGPERIEAGWWDGQYVARDYFVARNSAQSLLWVYRERNVAAHWYVHGFFS